MAIYSEASIGTTANRITFNNYDDTPIYRVLSRTPQRRQIRELDIQVPFESGISDFETLIGQMAYVIEGRMYPGGESEYDEGLRRLRQVANLELQQDDNLSDNGYVPYIFSEYERDKQIFLKVLYVDISEDTRKGLVQPFRLICKIKDPTIYGTTIKTADTSSADPTASAGTAILPFAFPIIFGASTYSVSSDAYNAGDLPTYPIQISIRGPVNNPRLTNAATGEYIEVTTNLSTTSNFLSITYDKDSLSVTKDGNSVLESVTDASTFFKLQPGSNQLTLTGSSIGTGAYATVSFYDAWALS